MSRVPRLRRPSESGRASRFWAIVVAIYVLAPVVMVVVMAFNDGQFLAFPPEGFSLRWFESIAESRRWRNAFATTLRLATLSSLLATFLALTATLGLRRFARPVRLQTLLMLPLIVPMVVTAFALVPFYSRIGLLGSFAGLVVAHALIALPFAVSVLWDSVQMIDPRLERAAQSLGASWGYGLRRVTLPLLAPAVVSAFIISTVISFDEVVATLFLSHPTTRTVPIEIWIALGQDFSPRAAAASVSILVMNLTVLTLGVLLSRCILHRRLRRGHAGTP